MIKKFKCPEECQVGKEIIQKESFVLIPISTILQQGKKYEALLQEEKRKKCQGE